MADTQRVPLWRRLGEPRPRSFNHRALKRLMRATRPAPEHLRPQTRADCVQGVRPCPFVGCRYHLYLDVSATTGALKLNFPSREPDQLEETCALDVADRGPVTLDRTGELLNVTRERVRMIETDVHETLRRRLKVIYAG